MFAKEGGLANKKIDQDHFSYGMLSKIVGYRLRRASALVSGDFARTFVDTGMRQVLFGVFALVAANPGTNQGAIGRALGIKRANMVALIKELVALGLIDRETASHQRAFALRLTEAGSLAFADAVARIEAHERRLMARLTEAERDQLIVLLGKIETQDLP